MARKFLDDIRAEIDSLFPDNITGLITPADLRLVCLDSVDSLYPDESALTQSLPVAAVPITATPTIPTNLFDGSLGGDGDFLKPNLAGGFIEGSSTAGFTYWIMAETSFIPGNNVIIEVQAMIDGVPFGPIQSITGSGVNDVHSLSLLALQYSMPVNGQLGLGYSSPGGAVSIDINSSETMVMVTPTNNP